MFFKFIKKKDGDISRFLFFNRNRANLDYAMTKTTNLPQFGFTEAFSYNHEKLKGFAPVAVVQVLNKGVYPKAGIQFAKLMKNYTIFTWIIAETSENPDIDIFFLGRYTPKFTNTLNMFFQLEFINTFPSFIQNYFTFIQRYRIGFRTKGIQYGVGLDFSQAGRNVYLKTENFGGFLRYEF